MSNLTFRGVTINYPDLRRKEASVFVRLHCSSDLSDKVCDAMEWQPVPDSVTGANLQGFLTAEKIVVTPTEKKLKDFELEMQCSRIDSFQLVRKKDGDNTITRLNFICMIEQVGAIQWIENWMRSVGEAPAAMKVTYIEQSELPLEGDEGDVKATADQRAAAMEIVR